MSRPPPQPIDEPVKQGLTVRHTWPVWANRVEHRVDVDLNAITGSTRVHVDGIEVARRGPWHMDVSGFELPFDVDGRPCLFVVRTRYGDQHEVDLYSEGRSLTTGDALDDRRAAAHRELPNLVRMLLIFIPVIGGFNTAVQQQESLSGSLGGLGPWLLIGIGAAVAAAGWWLASWWYARAPSGPARHVVGGAIVAGAWLLFFAAFILMLTLGTDETANRHLVGGGIVALLSLSRSSAPASRPRSSPSRSVR
jgi:hypothetical protein